MPLITDTIGSIGTRIGEIKAEDSDDSRTVSAIISTTSVDRDGEVMISSGMDAKHFNKNPVVLFVHDHHSLPIGRAEKLKKERDQVTASVRFADRPDTHPETAEWLPDTILHLFKEKVMSAFSIGFRILDAREATEKDKSKFGGDVWRIISKWELLEFSVVPVPANQDALATAIGKGLATGGEVAKLWDIKAPESRDLLIPMPKLRPERSLSLPGSMPLAR